MILDTEETEYSKDSEELGLMPAGGVKVGTLRRFEVQS